MKSRRVLQIFVAVLSFVVLVCLLLSAAAVVVAKHIDVTPQSVLNLTEKFKGGLKDIADKFNLPFAVVPAVAFGAPALLLLLAVILILSKNRGKDGKNIAGCILSLIAAVILTAFVIVFSKQLFDESLNLTVIYASAGMFALLLVFILCALIVRPKKIRITASNDEPAAEEVAVTETEEVGEEVTTNEEAPNGEAEVAEEQEHETVEESESAEEDEVEPAPTEELHDLNRKLALLEKIMGDSEKEIVEEQPTQDTPATQYVPHPDVTIHDVVEKTYGKEGDSLTSTTIQKINKVRLLFEAKAISEEEYLKLIRKYLGF